MIKFSHVAKIYDNVAPLKDVNGIIDDGEIVSIIGPSGTGKSTLLRMINGLVKPTSGDIYIDNIVVNDKNINTITKKVGMVFQSYNLFNHLNVIENLMIAQIEILKRDKQIAYEKSMKLLKEVGLESKENAEISELSGGEQQRIAFARTLAMDPEVLLLDEPTSALDPNSVDMMKALIVKIAKSGKTIVIVTHSMSLARDISDKIFFMDEGIIYEEGTPEEIFMRPKKPKTRSFINTQRTIEFKIDKSFDYNSAISQLIEFCRKRNIDMRRINKVMLVFEEVKLILFEKYEEPEIILKITFKNDETKLAVHYKGKQFDIRKTDNDISLKLIEGLSTKIEYNYDDDEGYQNEAMVEMRNS